MFKYQRMISNLKTARVQAGFSQDDLAKDLSVSKTTIRNIEDGVNVPNVLLAISIAKKVKWELPDLFKDI